MMDLISDGGLIHDVPITGNYWMDAVFYIVGSGLVGFFGGTAYCKAYRRAHHHDA